MSLHLVQRPLSRAVRLQFQHARQPQPFPIYALPASSRSFHATSRQKSIIDPVLDATHNALLGIHHVLPWWAAIPLAAVGVRLAFLPLTMWTRRIIAQQRSLTPLLTAWRGALERNFDLSKGGSGVKVLAARKTMEIYKAFSCQRYKLFIAPALQLPFFLIIIESIRRLAGAGQGLLRLLFSSVPSVTGTADGAAETASGATANTDTAATLIPASEPSMATEGPLWFVDLTAADPLLILPFALSATMMLHLVPSHYFSRTAAPVGTPSAFQRRLRNALKLLALAAGPLTLALPAGILYYWISTMLVSFAQGQLLDKFMPLKNPVMPCAPPKSKLLGNVGKAGWDTKVRDGAAAKLKAPGVKP
ncbi:hypothetical protein V495_05877 [Pseudogymnoascus sp. VKM F-4514 (FW-929)]|nr:hypothetical protein V495_05877 [Pseudogymnoascus sp. VKM F-4514 (FW-929)]KFY56068.1 hypothetical protein V497_06517 [Pseudogymnoascus sp. VKM F-4516 (FW-969)]